VIDLSTTAGIKLHRGIIAPLTTKFDGAENRLTSFLSAVADRATAANWAAMLNIGNQDPVNPRFLNLVTQHRMLTLDNIRHHAAAYVGQQTRMAQDASFMYEFLRESLTEGARTRLALQADRFTIQGFPDGPSYLKVILLTFYVETNATDFHLREMIHELPSKMKDLQSDILNFNTHVRTIVEQLASGGGESSDLILCLFKAYAVVEDSDFKRFIQRRKDDHDDGVTITAEALMALAQTKFAQLKQSRKWKSKTPEEAKLIALTAQLKDAKEKLAQLAKGKGKGTPDKGTPSKNADFKKNKGDEKNKGKGLKSKYPEWRFQRKSKETSLIRDGKTYWWCDTLDMWANHKPEDCRAVKKGKVKPNDKKEANASDESHPSALSIARALVAITDEGEGEEDS
jgi:hypothetical protein